MNSTTISLCRELAEEANAIIKYTEDIQAVGDDHAAEVLKDIRLDELEHVQKLALALSRVLIGEDEDNEGSEEPDKPAGGEG